MFVCFVLFLFAWFVCLFVIVRLFVCLFVFVLFVEVSRWEDVVFVFHVCLLVCSLVFFAPETASTAGGAQPRAQGILRTMRSLMVLSSLPLSGGIGKQATTGRNPGTHYRTLYN